MNLSRCETCGNDYDKSIEVVKDGRRYLFDSFECAIDKLAPRCAHCALRVIGHGVEKAGIIFCCVHCAEAEGVQKLQDRA